MYKNIFKSAGKFILRKIRGLGSSGPGAFVSPFCRIINPGRVYLGKSVVLEPDARICANGKNASIEIGDLTTVLPYVLIKCNGGKIKIGSNCSINDYCILYGNGNLNIGSHVHIAAHTIVVTSSHALDTLGTDDFSRQEEVKEVIIEDNVWIGANAVILKGVTIGKNSVIGAGAVVTKSIPSGSIAVGVPARVVKSVK